MRERAKMIKIPMEQIVGPDIVPDRCGLGQTFTCGVTVSFA